MVQISRLGWQECAGNVTYYESTDIKILVRDLDISQNISV